MPELLSRRRAMLLLPLGAAALGGTAFWVMLRRMADGDFDPHGVPNPLVGKAAPDFHLDGFSLADLRATGRPVLLNFFASWCQPCLAEADTLIRAREADLDLWGIAYKDQPDAAARFLHNAGNPFRRLAHDEAGRVAIDWGVTGVPETFLIDRDGIIAWHWSGPLQAKQLPVLTRLAA